MNATRRKGLFLLVSVGVARFVVTITTP